MKNSIKIHYTHFIFTEFETFALYFYGFFSICTIISICLSISTAVKIARFEKETGNRLTNSESKEYNNNKKWFVFRHFCMYDDLSY